MFHDFVNTSLDTAQERNKQRKRTPEKEVETMWNGVQQNMGKFQRLFGASNMIIVDNDLVRMCSIKYGSRSQCDSKKVSINGKRWISQSLKKTIIFFKKINPDKTTIFFFFTLAL